MVKDFLTLLCLIIANNQVNLPKVNQALEKSTKYKHSLSFINWYLRREYLEIVEDVFLFKRMDQCMAIS